MYGFKRRLKAGGALISFVPFALASGVALAGDPNPNSTTLSNGASLEVEIDNPADSTEFKVPAAAGPGGTISVPIGATGSVGQGVPNIHVTFVIDVSGSTSVANSCGGGLGSILNCEKLAVNNVITDPNFVSVLDVGVTVFANFGQFADMSAAAGVQPLTSDFADAQFVVNSAFSGGNGGVAQFTNKIAGTATDMTAGLTAAQNSVGASGAATKRVIFLSDGRPFPVGNLGAFDAAVQALGAQIDSFAIGANATCGSTFAVSLARMAQRTGGQCTEVPNPASLPSLLPDLVATSLDDVQIAVDASGITIDGCVPGLPAAGPISSSCSANTSLGVGDHGIEATVEGSDDTGSASVTANSVEIHLLQLTASPSNEVNELGSDNAHTVTAAILGGTGPDRNIDFQVGGQNAATATPANGSLTATPGGANVSFNYSVPTACSSLGTDTITVSTTIAGMLDSIVVTKDWVDTTAPVASCEPAVNPHGKNKPGAPGRGGQGQNQDGFYELLAADDLVEGCAPLIVNVRDADGFVFGPFTAGDVIKYTQDDGAPQEEKKMGSTGGGNNGKSDAVTAHLKGHGDLTISATDGAGNTGPEATCLVPPPPK